MTDEDRWRDTGPPQRGPSSPSDTRFNPLATGLGVFVAVAIPAIVLGYTRASGVDTTIIAIGIVIGLVAGLIVGMWVEHRGGRVWRGPQL